MSYTKGKWKVSGKIGGDTKVYLKGGEKYLAEIFPLGNIPNNTAVIEEARANARLMAAAPKLLAAVKVMLREIEEYKYEKYGLILDADNESEGEKRGRQAIAEAENKE